ncbi:hypothetical protein P8452_13138 [Trifolium repens]|nr:hypothetical protein P8452_13138 [Trifolium repens]
MSHKLDFCLKNTSSDFKSLVFYFVLHRPVLRFDIKKMGRRPPKTPPPSGRPKFVTVTIDQLFDPEYAIKYGTSAPVDWDDPETIHVLTKCVKLALADYNIQTRTDYRFVNIEMATWELSSDQREEHWVFWQSQRADLGFGSHAVIAVVLFCCGSSD